MTNIMVTNQSLFLNNMSKEMIVFEVEAAGSDFEAELIRIPSSPKKITNLKHSKFACLS